MDSLSQRDFIGTPDDQSKVNYSKLLRKNTEIGSDDESPINRQQTKDQRQSNMSSLPSKSSKSQLRKARRDKSNKVIEQQNTLISKIQQ